MELPVFLFVVANCPVAANHLLIATLTLTCVVVQPVFAATVVDIAMAMTFRRVGEEEDAGRLARRADAYLALAAIALVQGGSGECFFLASIAAALPLHPSVIQHDYPLDTGLAPVAFLDFAPCGEAPGFLFRGRCGRSPER